MDRMFAAVTFMVALNVLPVLSRAAPPHSQVSGLSSTPTSCIKIPLPSSCCLPGVWKKNPLFPCLALPCCNSLPLFLQQKACFPHAHLSGFPTCKAGQSPPSTRHRPICSFGLGLRIKTPTPIILPYQPFEVLRAPFSSLPCPDLLPKCFVPPYSSSPCTVWSIHLQLDPTDSAHGYQGLYHTWFPAPATFPSMCLPIGMEWLLSKTLHISHICMHTCVCALACVCRSVNECHVHMGSCRGQRRSSDLLELQVQAFVSYLM